MPQIDAASFLLICTYRGSIHGFSCALTDIDVLSKNYARARRAVDIKKRRSRRLVLEQVFYWHDGHFSVEHAAKIEVPNIA